MDLYYKRTEFPVQKLPLSKKGEAWRKACVDVLISREGSSYSSGRARKDVIRVNYDLYNGIFNEDDFHYVVNPFNVDDGFPAHPQNMNIIKPKIDLLIGEATKRPFNFKVFSTSEETVSHIQDKKKEMLVNTYLEHVVSGKSQEETDAAIQEIDTYMKNKYTTAHEQTAYNSLQYLKQQLTLDHVFIRGFKDALIAGEEIYYAGIVNGEPTCERVNPYQFTYDNDPDLEYIEDGDWAVRRFLMAPGAIYDRFQDMMDSEQLDELLAMTGGDSLTRKPSDVNYNSIIYKDKIISDINNDEFFKGQLLPVWHVVWKSFKKIGHLKYTDPDTGEEQEDIVDETYKIDKSLGESIEWDWYTEVWEGFRVGTSIYLDMRPVQYQYQSLENPKTSKLPFIGARYNATNTRNRSLVDTMKPLQYMYIVIWYRLELALARDKGKIINMDITQIPKSMGVDVQKWMHYLSALGVNLINPYEEGWDIPGREGGRPASYNQMSAQDLSMSNVIADYIGLLGKIEDMIGEISGVSRQREGSISNNELVGNVQRAVVQSSMITEPIFEIHSQIMRHAYTALLNTAKYAWQENDKKKLNFIVDDFCRQMLEIDDNFLYSDYDIFVNDSTKEQQNLEALRNLVQPAMQNGATLSDAATILMSDSISEITRKLKEIEEKRSEQLQQQAQQEQQMQMQMQQMQSQIQSEDNRIREEDSIRKAETAIQVAQINASSRMQGSIESAPAEDNGVEEFKLRLQQDKLNSDNRFKQMDLSETARSNRKAEEFKQQEIEIKRKQANKPVAKSSK